MGVNKLWDILLTIAVQRHIQDLSGLILAIDASLWIVKVNSIFQNIDEGLKCIFNKILWLRKNNIKPIFVFDGDTPALKRRTIQQRRNKRKQINQFDISKKVQIQIVKAVSGTQSNSQKLQSKTAYQQKSKQIDQMLNTLLKYQQPTNTIDISEKVALQAEVLNKKYHMYSQVNPNLLKKYGSMQYFQNLDIQSKQEILNQFQQQDWPIYRRNIRNLKQTMTEQQKILYDMEIIKQKSKIRQLQDNLYRKVMSKKTENGFEIIEGIYNGKKVIQKRRIKQKTFDQWGYHGKGKKDTLNDFKQIFLNKHKIQESQHSNIQQQNQDDNQGDFFSKMFSRDFSVEKRESSLGSLQQISKRMSQSNASNFKNFNHSNNQNPKKKKQKKTNAQIKKKQQKKVGNKQWGGTSQQDGQFQYGDIFNVEPKPEGENISKSRPSQQNSDPDNFPDFVMVQQLDELCTSSSNIHLQNMLDILGINYMVAPFEAEAQCAALQQMGLVDGVVTQDSDVFLFGARKVYRGLFQDNIKYYSMRKIQQKLSLTRQKLILFGLMLGSDYTDGVKGIGIVNAMEILKVHHDIEGLTRFTNWAKSADVLQDDHQHRTDYMLENAMSEQQRQFYKLHRKYKNYWHVHPNFPQTNIYNAYAQPAVQVGEQLEKKIKQHKSMHIDALKKIMEQKFKAVPAQIELNIKILSKPFRKKAQPQITEYIDGAFAKIASKRLQKAIDKRQIHD